MSSHSDKPKCKFCDYKTQNVSNMKRHVMRKHMQQNVNPLQQNVNPPQQNVNPSQQNVNPLQQNVNPKNITIDIDTNTCLKCNNVYNKTWLLLRHNKKCKGNKDPCVCTYCDLKLSCSAAKSRHLHICKKKRELDTQSLVLYKRDAVNEPCEGEDTEELNSSEETSQQIITNNNTTNNNINDQTNITNTVNNANTINNDHSNNVTVNQIILYDSKNIEFLNDHITKNELRRMVVDTDFSKVLTDYSAALLSRPENQCVRKTNLRSSSSAVHVGNDKWEYESDKMVLPKLLSHIATNFGNIQHEYKLKIMKELDTFMIDVTCEAIDCHEDAKEEARLQKLFKHTLSNVKHLLFNLTKRALDEKRKQYSA